MAIITSGASSDLLTIDPTSKAGRVTIYGPDGEAALYTSNRNRGIADIRVKQSTTTSASTVVWSIRSATSGKTLYIRRLWLQLYQTGTGAATEMQYEFVKATSVTAYGSSPTTVTPLLKRTSVTNTDAEVRMLDTGFTLTGAAFGSPFFNCVWPRLTHSATQAGIASNPFVLEFGEQPIELALNEVIAIRNVVTAVAGDSIIGGCEFFGG